MTDAHRRWVHGFRQGIFESQFLARRAPDKPILLSFDLPEMPQPPSVIRELLAAAALQCIYEHARAEYPRECCGFIHSSGIVVKCRNAQDDFHAADPDEYPRTSANGYCFGMTDQLLIAKSMDAADPVRIIYHSHPDAGAEFSNADRQAALFDGRPAYSDLSYLVIDCRASGVAGAELYEFQSGDFRLSARFAGDEHCSPEGMPAC